mmetsp:Transcript_93125/g.258874  ORF Transcript_93125/g.258874 Transcript_93125/m.258874 type:complete len:97 (+) Transcript_93125:158-448(+)
MGPTTMLVLALTASSTKKRKKVKTQPRHHVLYFNLYSRLKRSEDLIVKRMAKSVFERLHKWLANVGRLSQKENANIIKSWPLLIARDRRKPWSNTI